MSSLYYLSLGLNIPISRIRFGIVYHHSLGSWRWWCGVSLWDLRLRASPLTPVFGSWRWWLCFWDLGRRVSPLTPVSGSRGWWLLSLGSGTSCVPLDARLWIPGMVVIGLWDLGRRVSPLTPVSGSWGWWLLVFGICFGIWDLVRPS